MAYRPGHTSFGAGAFLGLRVVFAAFSLAGFVVVFTAFSLAGFVVISLAGFAAVLWVPLAGAGGLGSCEVKASFLAARGRVVFLGAGAGI